MKRLHPKADGASADITAENIAALKALFPECVTEGKVDFEVLRELLGSEIEDRPERYSFNWHGKSRARRIAQTPSTGTLRPCREESVNWDTTQNVFIEGDNLEALKLLQKSYHQRVHVIYIDPPYNTGGEFIYPDRYQDNLETYLQYTGQVDAAGLKVSANTESGGRYHTNWLNMMYPRLKLARNLLVREGVILISIDEHEFANLRKLADEVFGEENFIAELVWEKTRKNDAKLFSVGHEYILVYARDLQRLKDANTTWREPKPGAAEIIEQWRKLRVEHGLNFTVMESALREWYKSLPMAHPSRKLSRYKHIDENGPWRDRDISWPGGGGPRYDVLHPTTGVPCKVPERGWTFGTPEAMQRQIALGLIVFREDHTKPPFCKAHLLSLPEEDYGPESEADEEDEGEEDSVVAGLQVMPSVIYKQSQVATKYLRGLMGDKIFDNPKDHEVLARLIRYLAPADGVVFDFFAGSCATAESVLRLNEADGGTRKFVVVQLPEQLDPTKKEQLPGYKFCRAIGIAPNIAEIAKERLRRVANRIAAEASASLVSGSQPDAAVSHDTGFKVFKLSASNVRAWDAAFENLEPALLDAVENIKSDRTELDILYELLLKYGLDLAVPVDEREIAGTTVYVVGGGALIVCLADGITLEVVEGIAALKAELTPEIMRVVFKDTGFPDDVVKTNTVQVLRHAGIDDVKSL